MPYVLCAEGECHGKPWRQYLVITDRRLAIVEMVPALIAGWNFGKVTVQGEDDWPGMSAESILAWKRTNHPDAREVSMEALAGFGERLLAVAGAR